MKMTNDELNKLWHKHIMKIERGIPDELLCDGNFIMHGKIGDIGGHGIACEECGEFPDVGRRHTPDYTSDPAVFKGCVIELNQNGYHMTWYNIVQQYLIIKTHGKGSLGVYLNDPDPQRAVMLAVLKMMGKLNKNNKEEQ